MLAVQSSQELGSGIAACVEVVLGRTSAPGCHHKATTLSKQVSQRRASIKDSIEPVEDRMRLSDRSPKLKLISVNISGAFYKHYFFLELLHVLSKGNLTSDTDHW
jgi:hypothetical protein